ncbi:DUF4398 domain-containing protein [Piscinibacter gummiphilus]|uniref:DUF4398 domain-containing protein n=1 Tax=Piscinibacter gummiphilus TaxID=946333 RepID=A0ABZ0D0L4_9BURK|nr:DUF4398 domain-containing protein [Piscinibacter gummiphilus]WOB10712.1 DUF4398 domain-containing protein [Piscinibacter gummiphilus]
MRAFISTPVATAALCLVFATALGACASPPRPTQEMAVADAAVRRASTGSTAELAPLELQRAQDKLASAQRADARSDYESAAMLAEQAQIDAQVAQVRAEAARSRLAAQETREAARALREELNRKSTR